MAMTVAQLIEELKKHPKDSFVGMQHHDNEEGEIAAFVSRVDEFDPEESFDPDFCENCHVVLCA